MTGFNRNYNDPAHSRVTYVGELKPHQWAGTLRTVALQAERHDWPMERVHEVLDMLGLDVKIARSAKEALQRSRRLKWISTLAPVPTPGLKALPKPRTAPLPYGQGRDKGGRFTRGTLCGKGLHKMIQPNLLTRRDRTSVQCRACTVARGKAKA